MLIDPLWMKVGFALIGGLFVIVGVLLKQGFRSTTGMLTTIQAEVRAMNTTVIQVEAWAKAHDKQDDARHAELREEISKLWERG